jgi:hypothetical protein
MSPQSGVFPIYLRAEYRGDGLRDFVNQAGAAAQQAKREFEGIATAIDQALSRQRNTSGSLDLGVDEMRQALMVQKQVAAAAREVAEAAQRASVANGQFDASMGRAAQAALALADAEDKATREMLEQVNALEAVQRELNKTKSATDSVIASQRQGTTARGNVINSVRAERTAFIQLGQQLQDISIQTQMGTDAFLIFGQQVPQIAFALTGLEASANKTKAAIGRFATFMSGPFGTLIFIGIAALGPLVAKLFESADAADASAKAQRSLAEVLADTAASYDDVLTALQDYNREQEKSREVTLRSLITQAEQIRKNYDEAISIREKTKALIADLAVQTQSGAFGAAPEAMAGIGATLSTLDGSIERQDATIAELRASARNTVVQISTELAEINSDAAKRIRLGFEEMRNQAIASISDSKALTERLTRLNIAEKAQLDALKPGRTRRGPRDTSARDQAVMDRFAEQSAERVLRINERFQQQGQLVQQATQATRELDRVISEINRRMSLAKNLTKAQADEFARIKDEAEQAKNVIEAALLLPLQEARVESERRIQVQTLLAKGQADEAAALQATFQLEQQFGKEAVLRRDIQKLLLAGEKESAALLERRLEQLISDKQELRDIVLIEQQRTRELVRQQALIEAQGEVVRTVANDLKSLLSGRSTDFFGNFKQALLDLQGARLFEDLFGPAFEALQQELNGNTPQGRANQAYVEQVEKTADTTERLEQALGSLATAVDAAAGRLTGDGAANDNEIFVPGRKNEPVEFQRKSIKEIAEEIAKATVKPGVELLSRLIGRELAGAVGDIAAGVIAGQVRGGTPGAVLGGLEGLTKNIKGLEGVTAALGDALGGAETGTQVAGITKALGLPSNATGAQIGGAIGKLTGIPGGDIIGAIAGNFLGALIAGIPKGSATVNGVGVTSVVGNRSSLREAAGDLGSGVNDVIANVARQLGGRIGAVANGVSIGVRDGDFRVDPTGRGTTRVKGGAIDFGDDQEAAVRYAAQLLIERGVIAGIKASEQRLLQAGKTLEEGLRDVLDFRSVFDRLRAIRDPVGFAVEQLNREFERLIDLFTRAGASAEEFNDLRDLYDLERARAIEDANSRIIGSLQKLLNDLTIGDSGLSLRTRRANALDQFNGLASRVQAGDTTAFDDFADISKQLLEIERQLFGSTQSYFDRLAQITSLTQQAVADQTNITSIAAAQPSPFADRVEINRSIDTMNADVTGWLQAINDNLIAIGSNANRVGGGGDAMIYDGRYDPFPNLLSNF